MPMAVAPFAPPSARHQARSQVFRFGGQSKFLGGKIFVCVISLKQIFLSQQNLELMPQVVMGLGHGMKQVEDHWSIEIISRVRTD